MTKEKYLKQFIRTIPNFPKEGIMFRDITPTLEDKDAFQVVIDELAKLTKGYEFNKIICADARGFLFGSALAYKLKKGVITARKPGKLPLPGHRCSYSLEYGENTFEISKDALNKDDKVLVIDDLLATGGSASAMIKLVKMSEATPVLSIFYIELPDLKGREEIKKVSDIPVRSLISFEGE